MKKRKSRKRAQTTKNELPHKNVRKESIIQNTYLLDLPNEVIEMCIFPYLKGVDIHNLTRVGNHRLKNIAEANIEGKYLYRFPCLLK